VPQVDDVVRAQDIAAVRRLDLVDDEVVSRVALSHVDDILQAQRRMAGGVSGGRLRLVLGAVLVVADGAAYQSAATGADRGARERRIGPAREGPDARAQDSADAGAGEGARAGVGGAARRGKGQKPEEAEFTTHIAYLHKSADGRAVGHGTLCRRRGRRSSADF